MICCPFVLSLMELMLGKEFYWTGADGMPDDETSAP